MIYDIRANNLPKLYGNVHIHIIQDDRRGKHFPIYLECERRERVRLYCKRQIESIHNRNTKILIWIQVYYNCWKLSLKSSLVLKPGLRSLHLPMKKQLSSKRNICKRRMHLEEVKVGGLVGEGQLLATPSVADLTFQDRSFSLNIWTWRVC